MTVIFSESFETDGNGTRYTTSTPEFTDGSGDFFTRTDQSNIGTFYDIIGRDGGFYFAGMDLDGEGADGSQTLTFSGINIAGITDLRFDALFAEDDDGDNQDWDEDTSLIVKYRIDGGTFQTLLAFEAAGGSTFNTEPLLDTDFDGVGDGAALTETFASFGADIAGTGSSLDLVVEFNNLNAGDEDAAIDAISIIGFTRTTGPTAGITIVETDGTTEVAEGGATDSFDVLLDAAPLSDVTLTLASDGQSTATPTTLTFTPANWNVAQSVTVAAVDDAVFEGAHMSAITVSVTSGDPAYDGLALATVDVAITDNDTVPLTLISEIQGSGTASPLVGQIVTIEAVVVGDFQDGGVGSNGDLNGFFLQEEDADADGDAMTSEGLYVFDGFSPLVNVAVGDLVRVTGTVSEFFGETQLSSVTEVTVVSAGNSLPTAATITFPVASTTTNADGALIADLEAYEGMLVTVPQELTVSDLFGLGRFGEIGLHADGRLEQYTQANAPDVAGFNAFVELAARNTITLDDGQSGQNPETLPFEIAGEDGNIAGQFDAGDDLNAGDTVSGLTGVLKFSKGSGGSGDEQFRLHATETVPFENTNPREESAPEVGGDLKVAAFNVLNFFTTLDVGGNPGSGPGSASPRGADNQDEFDRQLDKLIAAMQAMSADIFGLMEIENEIGDQNGDGFFAIDTLAVALSAATGKSYAFADPGTPFVGGDAIMTGFIYDTATVKIADGTVVAQLDDAALPGLGLDFGNPVFNGPGTSRVPVAATFEEIASGEALTITVNHFKSKGSVSPFGNNAGTGDGTGNNNEARLQAAVALDAWLATNPTGSDDEDILIIGDLNAYAMEDPIQFLFDQGYIDTVEAYLGPDAFSYSFGFPVDLATAPQAQAFGSLDFALANGSLFDQVTGSAKWHINADEAGAISYDTNFKPQSQIDDLFAADPFRSSDHDPVIIGLDLKPDQDPDLALDDAYVAIVSDMGWTRLGAVNSGTDLLDNDAEGTRVVSVTVNGQTFAADGAWLDASNGGQIRVFESGVVDFRNQGTKLADGDVTGFDYTVERDGQTDTAAVTIDLEKMIEPPQDDMFTVSAETLAGAGSRLFRLAAVNDGTDLLENDPSSDTIVFVNDAAIQQGVWFDGDAGGQFRVFDSGVVDFRNQGDKINPGDTTGFTYGVAGPGDVILTAAVTLEVEDLLLV